MISRERLLKVIIASSMFLFASISANADDLIRGKYCYTYGDSESLKDARDITKTLAIKNALESYKVFVPSTTKINNFTLTDDMVQTLSAGYLRDVKVLHHSENGRTICDTVTATVKPRDIEVFIEQEATKRQNVSVTSADNDQNKALQERCIDTRKEPKPVVDVTIEEMKAELIVQKEIDKADKYAKSGELDEALRTYSFALLLSKDDYQKHTINLDRGNAIFKKANLFSNKQDFKTAIKILNKGLSLDDTDDHEKYLYLSQRAYNYKFLGQYDMAMDDINRAMLVATCSEKTELYEIKSDILIQKEQYTIAIQYCNAVISSPDATQEIIQFAYYDCAVAYLNLKQYEKALIDINSALATVTLKSIQALCYNTRGMIYVNINQHENAMKDFQKACDYGIIPACRELKNKK
jgi:tetratricopeptide (TPR) repeat protein